MTGHAKSLAAQVGDLARDAGLARVPEVRVCHDSAANAFAAGSTRASVITVTNGTFTAWTESELRGVLAHEIAHLSAGDPRLFRFLAGVQHAANGLAAAILAWVALGLPTPFTILQAILLVVAVPIVVALTAVAMTRRREFVADALAARLTGDPEALATALLRVPASRNDRLGLARTLFVGCTHPTTGARIRRLMGSR